MRNMSFCRAFSLVIILLAAGLPGRVGAVTLPPPGAVVANPALIDVYVVLDGDPVAVTVAAARAAAPEADVAATAKARGIALLAQHAALQPRLEALGAQSLSHFVRLANAIKIRVPADKLTTIAALPGVKQVSKVRLYQRDLTKSVPFIGTPAAWGALSPHADGTGIRIGIIDTGIDYTHADFGGSGNPDDFTNNDPTRIEPGSFPTAKVAGGYDFAGDDYDAGDPSHSVPHPDPDPLDCGSGSGHGTHVAGIAAGFGVLTNGQTYTGDYSTSLNFTNFTVGPGVAPRAKLYALKVFGCNGSTGLVVDALEWASDPNQDFSMKYLEVVNLSLGSTFGSNDPEDPETVAVNNLVTLGAIVVCAAGNDGNIFYAVGPPGSASHAIAAGNSIDITTGGAIRVTRPGLSAGSTITNLYYEVEGAFTGQLATNGPVSGKIVYVQPNDACADLTNAADLKGNIALIDRGTCFFVDKIQRAQDAGAIGVIMVDNKVESPITMGGTSSTITIPGVMISLADGALIKTNLSVTMIARLDATLSINLPQLADNLDPSSSRGPVGLANYLKPEIVAPGSSIFSAAMGTGTNGISFTGTSMASPTVAGAAAIMRQLHPSWKVAEIKAALMNSARIAHDVNYQPYPESRQGAGRLQVDQAVQVQVTAATSGSDGNIALCLGSLVLGAPFQTNRVINLTNHGTNAFTYSVVVSNTVPQDGVTVVTSASSVTVPANGSASVGVTFSADPSLFNLQPDPTTPLVVDNFAQQILNEASGQIWFVQSNQTLHVPYYASVRAASDFHATTNRVTLTPSALTNQVVSFDVPVDGTSANPNAFLSVFQLGDSGQSSHLLNPYNADADLLAVGAATDIAASGSVDNARLFFGLATSTSWPSPQTTYVQFNVLIDIDNDGIADYLLVNGNASSTNQDSAAVDVLLTLVNTVDPTGAVLNTDSGGFLNYYSADQVDTAPYNNSVIVETVAASQIGLSQNQPRFHYMIQASGFMTNVSVSGWIPFDASRPIIDTVDTSASGDGTPFYFDGTPFTIRLDQAAAEDAKERTPGIILLHHHNLEGSRLDIVRFDLSNDDTNYNGIPDWWEMKYFKNLTTASKTGDADHDGVSDYDEFLAGTDPTNPNSVFKILSVIPTGHQGGIIKWASAPGKSYTILRSTDLSAGFTDVVASGVTATPPANTFIDTETSNSKQHYYQIQLE